MIVKLSFALDDILTYLHENLINGVILSKVVLIVEDSLDLQLLLKLALSNEGFDAVMASNGHEALEVLRKGELQPFMILLDYMMPGMNGTEFLKIYQADATLPQLPIVVCSATRVNLPENVEYLKKPVDLDVLLEVVGRHFGQTKLPPPLAVV